MKNFAILCAATVLVASLAASVKAGEVSKSTLSSMGLGSISQMSDNDGFAIRGKGALAVVWGQSTATAGSNTSTNGYLAVSSHHYGSALAFGANISAAASIGRGVQIGVAGGASVAYAK